jgi:hypothetical protein
MNNWGELYFGSHLARLANLQLPHLLGNHIGNVSPLVENISLSAESFVDLGGNSLSTTSINAYISQPKVRAVNVEY